MKAAVMVAALCLLLGSCGGKPEAVADFRFLTPRPFGYVIGDEIHQRIELRTRPGAVIAPGSLPVQGMLNRWLNLNRVEVRQQTAGSGNAYRIDLFYQAFYAPQEVKMLTIPGFELILELGHAQFRQSVPPWHFTLSPLHELAIRKDDGGEYIRPDVPPPAVPATQLAQALPGAIALLLVSVAGLAAVYGKIGLFPRRLIFKSAYRRLCRAETEEFTVSLDIFHQALNRLYQKPLFRAGLTDFFQRFPAYRQLETHILWFFDCSDHCFFSAETQVVSSQVRDRLKQLCRACRAIERNRL